MNKFMNYDTIEFLYEVTTPLIFGAVFTNEKIVPKRTGCGTSCFISEYFNSEYEFMLPLHYFHVQSLIIFY